MGVNESIGGKRKRIDEGERAGTLAKKQKSVHKEEETIVILDSPDSASGGTPEVTESVAGRTGQRRRSLRNKSGTDVEPKPTEDKKQCDAVILLDSPSSETCSKGKERKYIGLFKIFLKSLTHTVLNKLKVILQSVHLISYLLYVIDIVYCLSFSQIVLLRMCPGQRNTSHSILVTSLETLLLFGSCTGLHSFLFRESRKFGSWITEVIFLCFGN